MGKYVINDKKVFETFVRSEEILKQGLFPMMSRFEEEEIDFWKKTIQNYLKENDPIIEIGCGSGRILKILSEEGFSVVGFDNNKLFLDYCKKRGLKVFYADATSSVSEEHQNKYCLAGVALNTLFNFPKEIRLKWVVHTRNLLTEDGYLVFSSYSNTSTSRSENDKRVKFYEACIEPPEGYKIDFLDKDGETGICMYGPDGKQEWFSRWLTKEELAREIDSWGGFKLIKIEPMDCLVGYNILVQKQNK